MNWTDEPRYREPDEDLIAAAARWQAAIDPERLRRLVTSLPGPRSRLHAPEAMAATDALILDAWRAAGWRVERQVLALRDVAGNLDYPDAEGRVSPHTYATLDGVNLIAELPGTSDRAGESRQAIVVVAHHDTVRGAPGAGDNGAGVAGLLELASLLAGRSFRRTVVLAAPDFEELGLIGSRSLVPWLTERYEVVGAIVFDSIAYTDRTPGSQHLPSIVGPVYPRQMRRLAARESAGDMVCTIYRWTSVPLLRTWSRCLAATIGRGRVLALRDPLDLPLVGRLARRIPGARHFSRSDHVNFWRAGVPALHVTDSANFRNPNYHQPTDTPETLDYETLAGIIAATALAVERIAGPIASAPPASRSRRRARAGGAARHVVRAGEPAGT